MSDLRPDVPGWVKLVVSEFEPNAQEPALMSIAEAAAVSQAISLRRIADALHGNEHSTGIWEILCHGRPAS